MHNLEDLAARLSSGQRKRITERVANSPTLLALWRVVQKPGDCRKAIQTERETQDRHRLWDVALDALAADEAGNPAQAILQDLKRFEVLLSLNLLSDALRLIRRVKRRALANEDRLYLPELLMREAYMCRLLGYNDDAATLASELSYWHEVRQYEQRLTLLALTLAHTPDLSTQIEELVPLLDEQWPISLQQEACLLLAQGYYQLGQPEASQAQFRQAVALLPADWSSGKSLRRKCLVWGEWLLHFPDAKWAEEIAEALPGPHPEERAEHLRQWVALLIDVCLHQAVDLQRWTIIATLHPLLQRRSLLVGLRLLAAAQHWKTAHQLLLAYPQMLEDYDEGLWHIYLLQHVANDEGAQLWRRRLQRKRLPVPTELEARLGLPPTFTN